jgi:hypothetical protein
VIKLIKWARSVPPDITISGIPWKIVFTEEALVSPAGEEAWGLCRNGTHEIAVSLVNRSSIRHCCSTLVHELFHAIWTDRRLPDKVKEEDAVQNLEAGFVGLFVENPSLLIAIQKGLK